MNVWQTIFIALAVTWASLVFVAGCVGVMWKLVRRMPR